MNAEQLDAIQARADAATGGNWEARQPSGGDAWVGTDYWPRVVGVVATKMDRRDANFIAAARTDVPALLALVREQAATIERVRVACDMVIDNTDGHKPPGPPHPTREQATAARIRAALTATDQP